MDSGANDLPVAFATEQQNKLRQRTAHEPLAGIQAAARAMEELPGVLVANTAAGYQYADVRCSGVSAVVVADGDPALARRLADELAGRFWEARSQLQIDFPDAA